MPGPAGFTMENSPRFGPYRIVQALEPTRLVSPGESPQSSRSARRFVAVHDRTSTSHLLYFLPAPDRRSIRSFLAAAEPLSALHHPHLLAIEAYSLCTQRGACLISPFTGHHHGLLTLGELLRLKGGRMDQTEALRAIAQVLCALRYAHAQNVTDGALDLDRFQVDTRGSLQTELFGLARLLAPTPIPLSDAVRNDVHAIILVARSVLAGAPDAATGPRMMEPKARPLDRRVLTWLAEGLDPLGGFTSANSALRALEAAQGQSMRDPPRIGIVRSALDRLRGVVPTFS